MHIIQVTAVTAVLLLLIQQQQVGAFDNFITAAINLPDTTVHMKIISAYFSKYRATPEMLLRYQQIMTTLQDNEATTTVFLATDKALTTLAHYVCINVDQLVTYLVNNPTVYLHEAELMTVNTAVSLNNGSLPDVLKLQTVWPYLELKVVKRTNQAGSASWVLPGLGINGSDINVVQTDIPSGRGYIHLIDNPIVDPLVLSQVVQSNRWLLCNCSFCNYSRQQPAADISNHDVTLDSELLTRTDLAAIMQQNSQGTANSVAASAVQSSASARLIRDELMSVLRAALAVVVGLMTFDAGLWCVAFS